MREEKRESFLSQRWRWWRHDAAQSLEHRDLTRRWRGTEVEGEEDIERDLRAVLRAQGRVVISGEGEGHEGGVS